MLGYEIKELSSKTQMLIKQNNLDVNQDGRINEENGELAELLSHTGKKNINELLYDSWWDRKRDDLPACSWLGLGGIGFGAFSLGKKANLNLEDVRHWTQVEIGEVVGMNKVYAAYGFKTSPVPNYDEVYNKHLKVAQKGVKHVKCAKAFTGVLASVALISSLYLLLRKPEEIQMVDDAPKAEQHQYNNEWEEKYTEAFGGNTPLVEYIPQKGEYWVSILKAKYGVDDETALKMANKIKEMIYGDAKAAKQSPIMYLPQVWDFEGNTYNYNNNAVPEKTTMYSDDVKTEQGKMTKELEY